MIYGNDFDINDMMNVLLIAGHFPPESSGGTGRPYSLYKYLPQFGINVNVITKNSYGNLVDEVNVNRFDSFVDWRKSKFFSIKYLRRITSFIGYKFFHIYPDTWWLNQVLKNIGQIIEDQNIELVYVTYPSAEAIRIGLEIKRTHNIKLITEFRDGLVFEPVVSGNNFLQKIFTGVLEKQVVEKSELIITIGNTISEYFKERYQLKNVQTVYNGFDDHDFNEILFDQYHDPEPFKIKIANFGSLSASRKGERDEMFIALRRLKKEAKLIAANFELSLIGRITEAERLMISKYGLEDLIKVYPPMPKKLGLKHLYLNFNYLLFYGVKGEKSIISSKLLEYINLKKPIIGICKGNEAERIISETATGIVCDFDVESIYATFVKVLEGGVDYKPNLELIRTFSRERQAEQISKILLALSE